jgi:hypothetical protein
VKRWIFNFAAALSLLLCCATLALWLRSLSQTDEICLIDGRQRVAYCAETRPGRLRLERSSDIYLTSPHADWRIKHYSSHHWDIGWVRGIAGFACGHPNRHLWWSVTPLWFWAILSAIAPTYHISAVLKTHRRKRRGHCPTCGYDLRATPDRCPECGTLAEHA